MMADSSYHYTPQHIHRKPMPSHLQPQRPYPSSPSSPAYSHSRSRTSSSSVFPNSPQNPTIAYPNSPVQQNMNMHTRRTPSTNTFSTTASSGNYSPFPARQSDSDLRRSTSSRSGSMAPASGYVALMRKQKATVWCDRAQHEDPRMVAAHKAAKMRAAIEVLGGPAPNRSTKVQSGSIVGSNRVTAKIRHHGKAGLVGYSPAENFGVGVGGVPMRLSATEVENGDSDEAEGLHHHKRTGSGRSSLGSARRNLQYRQSGASGASGRWSAGNTPPSEREGRDSMSDLDEAGETPVPQDHGHRKEYFQEQQAETRSTGSGSSGERNDAVAELGDAARLASNSLLKSAVTRERSVRNPEELRRRGSVDERTMTMSAQRLYIANPDEDSD